MDCISRQPAAERVARADENYERFGQRLVFFAFFKEVQVHHCLIVAGAFRQVLFHCRLHLQIENFPVALYDHVKPDAARAEIHRDAFLPVRVVNAFDLDAEQYFDYAFADVLVILHDLAEHEIVCEEQVFVFLCLSHFSLNYRYEFFAIV